MVHKLKSEWVNWNDAAALQSVILKSNSKSDVLRNMGYYHKSNISRKKLTTAIAEFKLDITHFHNRADRWNDITQVVANSYSLCEVLRGVGLTDQGDNFRTAKRYIKELNLDISHFEQRQHTRFTHLDSDIFCTNSVVQRSTLRKRIIAKQLLPYECAMCKITKWKGYTITLDLDHINGVHNDNIITNLRFLCPNCHSLTPTHRGKNNKRITNNL